MELFHRTCRYERMNVQRIAARLFVLAGGLIWAVAALASPYGNRTVGWLTSAVNAFALLALTAAVFVLGWFYERAASVLLLAGAAGAVVYGLATGWELGVWAYAGVVLIAPMLVAGTLFWLAARMQDVCEVEETRTGGAAPVA